MTIQTILQQVMTILLQPLILYGIIFCFLSCLMVSTGAPTKKKSSRNTKNRDLELPLLQKKDDGSKEDEEDEDEDDEDSNANIKKHREFLFRVGIAMFLSNIILLLYRCRILPSICWVQLVAFWTIGIPTSVIVIAESKQMLPDNACQHFLCTVLVFLSYYSVRSSTITNNNNHNNTGGLEICAYHFNLASVLAIIYWTKHKKYNRVYIASIILLAIAQIIPLACGPMGACHVPVPGDINITMYFDVFYFSGAFLLLCCIASNKI